MCAALLAIGALLELIDLSRNHVPAGVDVSDAFAFVGPVLAVLGACFVGAAFLGSPRSRAARLATGVGLSAAYYLCGCATAGILGGVAAAHHVPGRVTAAFIVGAVSLAIASVSSVVGVTGFGLTRRGWSDATSRDVRLGIAAAIYGAAMVAALGSNIISLVGSSSLTVNGTTTTAAAFEVAADLVQMAAAATVAISFFGSVDRQRRGVQDWLMRRDRIIAGGFVGFFLGFLLLAVADLMSAAQDEFVPNLYQAGRWVTATGSLMVHYVVNRRPRSCGAAAAFAR